MKLAFTCIATIMAICIGASDHCAAQGTAQKTSESEQQTGEVVKQTNNSRTFATSGRQSSHASFTVSISPAETDDADTVTIEIETSVAPDWQIGPVDAGDSDTGLPTTIEVESDDLIALDDEFVPSAEPTTELSGDDAKQYHTGSFKWSRNYKLSKTTKSVDELTAKISLRFQVCDKKMCLPPKTINFTLEPISNSKPTGKNSAPIKFEHEKIGEPIEVTLSECDKERRQVKMGDVSVLSLMFSGIGNDSLDLSGQIDVGSESYAFYLPEPDKGEDKLGLVNSGTGRTRFENTASYMSIDHNGDGKLSDWEAVAMDGPIRIADSMFRVTSVDRKSKLLTFQQVDAPIEGAIVGRMVPPFSYTTTEGDTVSDKSILGKVTILDIWAVT